MDYILHFIQLYWGLLVGAIGAGGIATAILASVIKGGISVLASRQSADSAALKNETRESIELIREDVAELKEKMYLDAKINASNPVLNGNERRAYHQIGTKSMIDKIEDSIDVVEKVVDLGTSVAKHWSEQA